jgi:hypothetical protein
MKTFNFLLAITVTATVIAGCSVKKSIKHGHLITTYYNGTDSLLYLVSGLEFLPVSKKKNPHPFYADITYQYAGGNPDSAVFNFTFISPDKNFRIKSVKIEPVNYFSGNIARFFVQPYKKGFFKQRYSFKMSEKTFNQMLADSESLKLIFNDSLEYVPSKRFHKQADYCLTQLMFNE